MGLLDLLRPKKRARSRTEPERRRPGQRGKAKSPAERIALAEVRYLDHLERDNPAEFRKLMRIRVERKLGVDTDDGELAQLARTVGQLKELGMFNGQFGGGGGRESWIRDAVDGLRMLVQYQQPSAAAVMPNGTNGTVHVAEAQTAQTAQVAQTAQAALPEATTAAIAAPALFEAQMTPTSQYLIAQLEHRTPAEAAEWLIAQKRPEAQRFVASLCSTPDAEHASMLLRLAAEAPDLAAFVVWVQQRPELLSATVQELRIRTQQFPPLHPSQNVGI